MTPRQRLFRAVNWASGLTLFALAIVLFGFFTCYSASYPMSSAALMRADKEPLLPDTASDQAVKDRAEKHSQLWDAAYSATNLTTSALALFVALPVAVLLVIILLLLSRVRSWSRRGV